MNYTETINYLYKQLPVFHRIGRPAYKANFDNTYVLDQYFGSPHKNYCSVHVAGTNGKGSVSHFVASILQSAGYKTGLYTSPHIIDFRERIKIDGKMIPKGKVITFVEKHKELFENLKPSFFEMSVFMALDHFSEEKVDFAIIETGMGGRLDSTNIIKPEVTVITNISYDHTEFLGETLEKIAYEKAGIIKENVPVVIGESRGEVQHVFDIVAREKKSLIFLADKIFSAVNITFSKSGKQVFKVFGNDQIRFPELKIDLFGKYQVKNVLTALQTIDVLSGLGYTISDKMVLDGFSQTAKKTGLTGRWHILGRNPLIICDTAHNEDGLRQVVDQLNQLKFKRLHVVFGMVKDKDHIKVLPLLPKTAVYYFTQADIPRALPSKILLKVAKKMGLRGVYYENVNEAYHKAIANADKDDVVFIGGSTFIVAEVFLAKKN